MRASFGSGRNGRTQGEAPPGKTGDACQSGSGGGGRGGAFRRITPTVGDLLVAFINPVKRFFPPLDIFFTINRSGGGSARGRGRRSCARSEEHTAELQSLMR